MLNYRTYIVLFLLGVLFAMLFTPLMIVIAKRFAIVDKPGVRKVHKKPTPLLGGVAIAIAMWVPPLLLLLYDNFVAEAFRSRIYDVAIIFTSGLLMLILGLIDDMRGLNARQKLMVQIPVAAALVLSGIRFGNITIPGLGGVDLGSLSPVITFIWIVGVCNAINLIDGLDGLAAGVAMFAALTNGVIAILNGNVMVAVLMITLAGACMGFLHYNFHPAKIFLGDSGSLFLGITLAVTSILGAQKGTMAASLLIPALVLGYPVFDTLIAMARRFVKGKSMFSGDRKHIHHMLLEKFLDQKRAVMVIYVGCALFSVVALLVVMENNFGIAIGFVVIGLVSYVSLRSLGYFKNLKQMLNGERTKFRAVEYFGKAVYYQIKGAKSIEEIYDYIKCICHHYESPGFNIEIAGNGKVNGYSWFKDEQVKNSAVKGRLECDVYDFSDSGLKITFYYAENVQNEDLHTEKRNLLGEIADVTNERIKELVNS
jgi:UDP-GlcNAc:undecaprenyl-phosphate GlcNAc-1-phosphate transferase